MGIRIGIYGYGNLGKGVELAVLQNPDMELAAIFTRRDPAYIAPLNKGTLVLPASGAYEMKNKIDVMILCGGSATDLPEQTPLLASAFNVVDSFDTHARIGTHYANVDKAAKDSGHAAIISVGWDPGLFSLNRMISNSILPEGKDYTFWGKGVSQGHSDAIRRISGVADARQYTIPIAEAVDAVRSGDSPEFTTRQKHRRECFVVAKDDADTDRIKNEIINMPDYFADYETSVTFISSDELVRDHSTLPHGGSVIYSGKSASGSQNVIEFSLKLDSNPEFTSSVLVAYARAAFRLYNENNTGCKTIFDIAPAYLSPLSGSELIRRFL